MSKVSKYVRYQLEGYNKQESALRAGYAPSTARNPSSIERSQQYQITWGNIDRELRLAGIDEAFIAQALKNALEAKKSTFYRGQEVVGKQGDHKIQLRAIELYLKIRYNVELEAKKSRFAEVSATSCDDVEEMSNEELNTLLTSFCE